MKKFLIMAALLLAATCAACSGEKTKPETAAESAAAGTEALETQAAETEAETFETEPAETETETETETLETEPAQTQPAETQPAETEKDGAPSAARIRESQNEMCAAIDAAEAAFGVLVIDPEFEGAWPDVSAAIAFSGYADRYPYLTSIGFEQYIETEGQGLICIIPRDMSTSLSVNLVDEDLEVKKVLYRHEMAYPLLIRTSVDPEAPELMISGVSGKYQATFYVMSDKGRLMMPNGGGVYDFTEE